MRDPDQSDHLARSLVAAGTGDRVAFHEVYVAASGRVLAICLSVIRDRAIAEDIMQDVFVKIWRSASGYDPDRARPMTWMGTIARNSAIDWVRARKRGAGVNYASSQGLDSVPSETEPVDSRMVRQEDESEALRMVGELPEELMNDIKAIYFEGLTYAEASEREGIPVGTLKSRVRRGLIALRKRLSNG